MLRIALPATLGVVIGFTALATGPSGAAEGPPPNPFPPATANPAGAPAGTYPIDPVHASIVARVPHQDFSFNVVRFTVTGGSLDWDPAKVENSKVTVTADAAVRSEPIVYLQDLKGPNFMNVAQFATISFVSTGVRRTGPTTGVITGDLTLLGQTKPATIDARLVGAGQNARGVRIIGFTGTMKVKRADFGFRFMPGANDTIDVLVDAEFAKPA